MAKAKIATQKEVELKRWCVEMAMRWPVITSSYGYGNPAQAGGYQQNLPRIDQDADVIGRATKIRNWVTSAGK